LRDRFGGVLIVDRMTMDVVVVKEGEMTWREELVLRSDCCWESYKQLWRISKL
jgi:hypothetical protein